jgi:HAMP domain-containing protein
VSPTAYRTFTALTAALLAFDGAALLGVSVWKGRLLLALIGSVFLFSAVLVLFSARWYQRRLVDIAAARRALGEEQNEMQRVIRKK